MCYSSSETQGLRVIYVRILYVLSENASVRHAAAVGGIYLFSCYSHRFGNADSPRFVCYAVQLRRLKRQHRSSHFMRKDASKRNSR